MIAALFALLLSVLAHVGGPAPASPAHEGTVPPAPAVVAPAPASGVNPSRGGDSASISPGVSGTQPGPAEETVQRPEEVTGRQIDCPSGVGTMAGDGSVTCPSAP